ncbi:hypothetical protein MBLNU230_g0972t1 [Neophaeotheca triangularis]
MPPKAASKQRRLTVVNGVWSYEDGENIVVATPRATKEMKGTKPIPARAVKEKQAAQAAQSTKTTRILKEVLVPAPARTERLSETPRSSNTSVLEDFAGITTPNDASSINLQANTNIGRPKRQRSSIRSPIIIDDTSEDELMAPTKTRSNKRRRVDSKTPDEPKRSARPATEHATKRKVSDSDDEYQGRSDIETDDLDEDDADAVSEAASTPSEGSISEDSAPPKKGKATAKARVAVKAPVEAKQAQALPRIKPSRDVFRRLIRSSERGLKEELPPLSDVREIFQDMTAKALGNGLNDATKHLSGRSLRVATMCSGTESPLLALELIQSSLRTLEAGPLHFTHLFSAEIVPFKQAYIQRNFQPHLIFRDITELIGAEEDETPQATTAYGALAEVPRDVDLIIAGTSCVDYSSKNRFKKDIDGGGESGDTFRAVLDYSNAYRPAVVLLENVAGAAWAKMIERYNNIGYDAVGVLVDTKDYYIPHTRQRGYMICIDRRRGDGQHRAKCEQWQDLMGSFRRPASSSTAEFLLPSGTLESLLLKLDAESARVFDWSKCEIRHIRYRQEQQLGNLRPFTHWQESGTIQPPENGDMEWFRRLVERVKDTVEIANLRSAVNGYDASYKTRIWDLSQNVDRFQDTGAPGMSPCITPSGIAFVTDRNSPLRPLEAMKLQGLPIDRVLFTTETEAEILDMSGNAMTSTVIGSAILSALISSYPVFDRNHSSEDSSALFLSQDQKNRSKPSDILPGQALETDNMRQTSVEATSSEFDVTKATDMAEQSSRKCYCEGAVGMSNKPIQRCKLCAHTTCVGCGGNPQHEYSLSSLDTTRLDAQAFETYLRMALPLRTKFNDQPGCISQIKDNDPSYAEAVTKALEQCFTLAYVRRTHFWRAVYESEHAILQLVFQGGLAEWRLYAKPDSSLPVDNRLRIALKQPIGKCSIDGLGLFSAGWKWRMLCQEDMDIDIRVDGAMVPSWWARIGLTGDEFRNHKVASQLTINTSDPNGKLEESLDGTYCLLPNCGTATSNLYKREEDNGPPLFLFLDPDRTGPAEKDRFVFSHDKSMMDYDEVRPVLGRISARWRPYNALEASRSTKLTLDGTWVSGNDICLAAETASTLLHVADAVSARHTGTCQTAATLVSGTASLDNDTALRLKSKANVVLDQRDAKIFNRYAWLFECMRRQLCSEWRELDTGDLGSRCECCVPKRPLIKWSIASDGDLKAYEDVEGAAKYERAVKARPVPLFAEAQLLGDGNGNDVVVSVGLNLRSLAHRAAARLPDSDTAPKLEWLLDTSGVSKPFYMKRFILNDTAGEIDIDESLNTNLDMQLELFAKQRLAFSWMRSQERGKPFTLERAEESTLTHANWRVEMRASREIEVRGGICADHPGFGKTVTSLALVQAEFQECGSLERVVDKIRPHQEAEAPGRIPIAATLIIAPIGLVSQWASEIGAILPSRDYSRSVLVIKTIADLAKHTIQSFQSANIILLSRGILDKDDYTDKLAAFAGMPGPAASSGRAYSEWLNVATAALSEHLRVLLDRGEQAFKQHVQQRYRDHMGSDAFNEYVPSRRLRGSKYVAKEQRATTTAAAKAKAKAKLPAATLLMDKIDNLPLLELFYFNRIVVDEFHECNARQWSGILGLKSDKHWGLSGTPALGDSYEVAQVGRLLGVSLPVASDMRGILLSRSIKAIRTDRTNAEQFEAMQHKASNAMHQRIWELDQNFLDAFVRRNVQSFDDMPYQDHLLPVRLDLDHRCIYTELSQHLNSQDMKLKGKSKDAQETDVALRINRAVQDADTPEESLSKTAAFMPRNEVSGLEQLIQTRQDDIESALEALKEELAKYRHAAKKNTDDLDSFARSIYDDALRDAETLEILRPLIRQPAKASGKKAPDATLRGHVADIKDIVKKQVLVAKRSLRFSQNMATLAQSGDDVQLCQSEHCGYAGAEQSKQHMAVSAFCGHAICRDCYEKNKLGNRICPATGCSEHLADHNLLWARQLGNLSSVPVSPHGAKLEAALNLLNQIQAAGDKAILFVQFDSQLDQVKKALQTSGLRATVVESREAAGEQIEAFKQPTSKTDVIVLDSSSGTAAGFNLQIANHVIFLSPLLCTTQYDYEATMAQAIGRVRRHGQTKSIHVYRIVALDTIDVDILEHRERRATALTEQDLAPIEAPEGSEGKKERTQLVRGRDGKFSLRPQSWLIKSATAGEGSAEIARVQGRERVMGWEDFSSLVKFSKTFTEDDD